VIIPSAGALERLAGAGIVRAMSRLVLRAFGDPAEAVVLEPDPELVASGVVSASVETTYTLGDFREAFEHAQRKERTGKVPFVMQS
jgi:hypothetical protein